jgi:hypothetical protein
MFQDTVTEEWDKHLLSELVSGHGSRKILILEGDEV